MSQSAKFWIVVLAASAALSWLLEIPVWVFPIVAIAYIGTLNAVDWWQKSDSQR